MSVDFNASFSGSAETFGAKMTETPASMTASMKETGGGSASNYEALRNKPKINGHELIGDMTPSQLGITDDSRPQPRKAARRHGRRQRRHCGHRGGRLPRRQHRAPDLLRGLFRDCILQLRR
nr:MAG: hypothetical protein [Bacteriophage sp.]